MPRPIGIQKRQFRISKYLEQSISKGIIGGTVNYELPSSLQNTPSEIADFRATGKINNFFGLTIDRMPEIDGVLAYSRDRVIDLKAKAKEERQAEPAVATTADDLPNEAVESSSADAIEEGS